MRVERLAANPIVRPGMDPRLGSNINGPSLIAAPSWLDNPLGRYYLYFAHHSGDAIRLAVADALEGPWRVHGPGTLQLGDTPCTGHIASPDVHVDAEARQVRMYFHGPSSAGGRHQRTFLATSDDGLAFTTRSGPLGMPYWRLFAWNGWWYALEPRGHFRRARDPAGPFEVGPPSAWPKMRHCAVLVQGDRLHVAWSEFGARPERLLTCAIALEDDWTRWKPTRACELLRPEHAWEGARLPLATSKGGIARRPVRQLRDPAWFEEDGQVHLLYSVAGEQGIGIARVHDLGALPRQSSPRAYFAATIARAGEATRVGARAGRRPGMVKRRRRRGLLMRLTSRIAEALRLARATSPRRALRILRLDRRPIFVAGCGRSGTTLLLAMLAAHPHIVGIPQETDAFLGGRGQTGRRRIHRWLAGMDLRPGATRWAEKTPRHVRQVARILAAYPEARFLVIVRDGRDVVTSVHPSAPDRYWVTPERWVSDVQAGRDWEGHPQVLTLRYEDLVMEPEATLRRVCAFLGERYTPAMLSFARWARSHEQFVEFPVRPESIGRWRKLRDDPAIATLMADPEAVALLRHYGYLDVGGKT